MDILEDMRVQWAVYWPPGPLSDEATRTFGEPVELLVRWEEVTEMFLDRQGNEQVSKSKVYVGEDLTELGVLWLSPAVADNSVGSGLAELVSESDPFANPKAYEIRRFDRIPTLDGDEFLRIAYL
jgi:hypothetical protein